MTTRAPHFHSVWCVTAEFSCCTRYGLAIGAFMSPVVWMVIGITFPLSWPLSKLLDAILGQGEATFFRRGELKELVLLQQQQGFGEEKLTEVRFGALVWCYICESEWTHGAAICPSQKSALLVRRHTHVLADGEGWRGLDALGEPKLQSFRSTR